MPRSRALPASVTASLRFELFFALAAYADPHVRVHVPWVERARDAAGAAPAGSLPHFGDHPFVWVLLPDALPPELVAPTFEEIRAALAEADSGHLQRTLLVGALHDERTADGVLAGQTTLAAAVAGLPETKREWLSFAGLFPYDPARSPGRDLELLLRDPGEFVRRCLAVLTAFWERSFRVAFARLEPQLARSAAERERLYAATDLGEFARRTLLRVEVDEERGVLRALRGGYELALDRIERLVLVPSAFNDRRHWTNQELEDGRQRVWFPYFDPALDLGVLGPSSPEPANDPALTLRALGDTTRLELLRAIADRPRSATELAEYLGLKKPTISHHVHILREAGLLVEEPAQGSVILSPRWPTIERLSADLLLELRSASS